MFEFMRPFYLFLSKISVTVVGIAPFSRIITQKNANANIVIGLANH
jgi:hypothetical protein